MSCSGGTPESKTLAGRVVITGFGQFPGVTDNPSHRLIAKLRDTPGLLPTDTTCHLIEVNYRAVRPVLDAILVDPPAVLVMTGFSRRARELRLETQAHDYRSPDRADAFGFCPPANPAKRLFLRSSKADLSAIAEIVARSGIGCILSADAGAYVCNHTYHTALSRIAERALCTRAVFIHIPAIEGTALARESDGAMPLDTMVCGVALVAKELLHAA